MASCAGDTSATDQRVVAYTYLADGRRASKGVSNRGIETTPGDGDEAELDRRYFYHEDRNWNVIALTEYDDGVGTNGRIGERYAYTPYGELTVLKGDAGSGELGSVRLCSARYNRISLMAG